MKKWSEVKNKGMTPERIAASDRRVAKIKRTIHSKRTTRSRRPTGRVRDF